MSRSRWSVRRSLHGVSRALAGWTDQGVGACACGSLLLLIWSDPDVKLEYGFMQSPVAFKLVGAVNCPGRFGGRFCSLWLWELRQPHASRHPCSVSRGGGGWDLCVGWHCMSLLLFVVVRLGSVGIGGCVYLGCPCQCRWV